MCVPLGHREIRVPHQLLNRLRLEGIVLEIDELQMLQVEQRGNVLYCITRKVGDPQILQFFQAFDIGNVVVRDE